MNTSNPEVLGYQVYGAELAAIEVGNQMIINTLNGHSYSVAKRDTLFREALQASDILLPDGVSVVFGARVLCGQRIRKIAGFDIFTHLLERLNEKGGSCFFLGAGSGTLEMIRRRLAREYPRVRFGAFSPPYRDRFSEKESRMMCDTVNAFAPDVLFVGMTAPKQEKWVHANKNQLNVPVVCSIGAVFGFYAGTVSRPPQWVISLHLEWLGRLLREPRRLWRRYLLSTPVFFIDVVREKMKRVKK